MNTLKEWFNAQQHEQMLMEAISDADLRAITKVIALLKRVDFSAMPNIDQMIDNVINDLNNMMAKGGRQTGAVGFLKRLFTKGESAFRGPVGKALALVTTLENGFKQLPAIIQANIKDNDPGIKDRSLSDIAANKRGPLDMAIRQAFTKSAISIKGVKLDDSQLANIVDDIMAAKLSAVAAASKALASAPSSTDAVSNLMNTLTSSSKNANQQNDATTKTQQTTPTEPTTAGTSTSQTSKQPLNNKEMGQKLRDMITQSNIDIATFKKVYKALKDSGIDLKWGNQNINIAA